MTRILAIATSTDRLSLALLDDNVLLAELSLRHGRNLSRVLIPTLGRLLDLAGARVSEMDSVAAAVGPGSFTGLRVGVTAAKTLAFAAGITTAPVSTLHALAASPEGLSAPYVLALMDARRQEAFAGLFRRDGEELLPVREESLAPLAGLPDFVARRDQPGAGPARKESAVLSGLAVVVAADASAEVLAAARGVAGAQIIICYPQARAVATLARRILERGGGLDPMDLLPVYLRRSYAEEKLDP